MTLLLYFTSFTAMLTLIVSAVIAGAWLIIKFKRAATEAYRSITDPEARAARRARRRPAQQPHQFKRAGQW